MWETTGHATASQALNQAQNSDATKASGKMLFKDLLYIKQYTNAECQRHATPTTEQANSKSLTKLH